MSGRLSGGRQFLELGAPLVGGGVLTVVATGLGNPIIPVGTAELVLAFALGAVFRKAPLRIGALITLPPAATVVISRFAVGSGTILTLVVFSCFALFNGLAAGAGLTWAEGLRRWRRGQGP